MCGCLHQAASNSPHGMHIELCADTCSGVGFRFRGWCPFSGYDRFVIFGRGTDATERPPWARSRRNRTAPSVRFGYRLDRAAAAVLGRQEPLTQVGTAKANRAPVLGVVSECWLSYHRQAPDRRTSVLGLLTIPRQGWRRAALCAAPTAITANLSSDSAQRRRRIDSPSSTSGAR
jgi:hypothetical protein